MCGLASRGQGFGTDMSLPSWFSLLRPGFTIGMGVNITTGVVFFTSNGHIDLSAKKSFKTDYARYKGDVGRLDLTDGCLPVPVIQFASVRYLFLLVSMGLVV